MRTPSVVNALSFDIEDWFHIVGIPGLADPTSWDDLPTLVEERTTWILDCLAQEKVTATFFVLGWIAERYPQLVRQIHDAGHEIGSHAFWHRRIDQLTPAEFTEELTRSVQAIEDICGAKVYGFRAPSFSITPGAEWALDVLLDAGLEYDASLFPAKRSHGGYPCQAKPHVFQDLPSGRSIPELPMTVLQWGPFRLPFSGGGYLRLLPLSLIHAGFRRVEKTGYPTVVYLHPRDFAPDCPRAKMPPHRHFKCYVGLGGTENKLQSLLQHWNFDTCREVLRSRLAISDNP